MPVLGVLLACGFPAGDLVSLKQELRKDPYRIGFHTNLLPGQSNLIALQWWTLAVLDQWLELRGSFDSIPRDYKPSLLLS
jgi:hypothetical protein